jgi:hypothetical protein
LRAKLHYDGQHVLSDTIDHGDPVLESRIENGIKFAGKVQRICDCRTVICRTKRAKIIPIALVNSPANYEVKGNQIIVTCPKCRKEWGRLKLVENP